MKTQYNATDWLRPLALAGLCAATFGCDSIIAVEPADRVDEATLEDPSQALVLVNSVQATFECAYSGYVVAMGLFADELNSLGATHIYSYDRRDPSPAGGFVGVYADGDCATPGLYKPLSSARWFADDVAAKLEGWTDAEVPDRTLKLAQTQAYAGYSLLLLGESMCSAAIDEGPELSQQQLFGLAEERFTAAIAAADAVGPTADEFKGMSLMGRARALLNVGNTAGALADAQGVPAGFLKNALYDGGTISNTQRRNEIFFGVNLGGGMGLAPSFFAVEWMGVADPRVPILDLGLTTLQVQRVIQLKYNEVDDPIPLATWEEAQLIVAEIELGQTAVDIINVLHTNAGIPAFDATGLTDAEILDHVIEERRRELFLTGHRAYDRGRLGITLEPATGTPFRWGGIHGSAVCFPLPNNERDNNPNI